MRIQSHLPLLDITLLKHKSSNVIKRMLLIISILEFLIMTEVIMNDFNDFTECQILSNILKRICKSQ